MFSAIIPKAITLAIIKCVTLVLVTSVYADSLSCSAVPVTFSFDPSEEFECLCGTVTEATTFLESIGLQTTDFIAAKIVKDIPCRENNNIFGAYNSQTQELSILTYSRTKDSTLGHKQPFNVTLTKELWCSFAAHELAHAIINQHVAEEIPARFALEYIAYVTQLKVLESKTREKILSTHRDVEAFASIAEMTDTYYFLDPNRFAVKCYLHFMTLDEPSQFIGKLIETVPRD